MKGNNKLILNEATVCAAIQLYLEAQMKDGKAPLVQSVKSDTSTYDTTFSVELREAPPASEIS